MRDFVLCTLRTQMARATAALAPATRGWRARLAAAFHQRLGRRDVDRLSDHMLKDLGLECRDEPHKAVDWLLRR